MMTEQQNLAAIRAVVDLACKDLTNEELAVLHLVSITDDSPHGRLFDYNKVKPLFTEANGTRMHSMTKEALAVIVGQRLS